MNMASWATSVMSVPSLIATKKQQLTNFVHNLAVQISSKIRNPICHCPTSTVACPWQCCVSQPLRYHMGPIIASEHRPATLGQSDPTAQPLVDKSGIAVDFVKETVSYCNFHTLQSHPRGRTGPFVRPVLARRPYVWHPWFKVFFSYSAPRGRLTWQ